MPNVVDKVVGLLVSIAARQNLLTEEFRARKLAMRHALNRIYQTIPTSLSVEVKTP